MPRLTEKLVSTMEEPSSGSKATEKPEPAGGDGAARRACHVGGLAPAPQGQRCGASALRSTHATRPRRLLGRSAARATAGSAEPAAGRPTAGALLTAQVQRLRHLLGAGQLAAAAVLERLKQQLVGQQVHRQLLVAKGVDAGGAAARRGAHLRAGGRGGARPAAGWRACAREAAAGTSDRQRAPLQVSCRTPAALMHPAARVQHPSSTL